MKEKRYMILESNNKGKTYGPLEIKVGGVFIQPLFDSKHEAELLERRVRDVRGELSHYKIISATIKYGMKR